MQDITYYTKLILSPEVQTLIDPYRNVFILISIFFIAISLFLIFQEKYFIADTRRRILDFFSDPRKYEKPRKFVALWNKVNNFYKKEDYKNMVIEADNLILQILKRFGYVGDNSCAIIDGYGVTEGGFPNMENVKRISELSKSIRNGIDIELGKEEMTKIYDLSRDTLIKIGILDK